MFGVEFAGTGMYVPKKVLTNSDLEKIVNTDDNWIRTRTGIIERRIADKNEGPSDLGAQASREALKSAGISPESLDMIIVCTSTPDVLFPSTACFVQEKIGADRAVAYDISAACSGFVYGLSIAEQYLKNGRYENILVVGTEVYSRILDWNDRATCVIFGDGSGAVLLRKSKNVVGKGLLSTHIYSDGSQAGMIGIPGGIGKSRISKDAIDQNLYVLKMDGGPTFKLAVRRMVEVGLESLRYNKCEPEDLNLIIPHQANKRIIDAVANSLNVPKDKFFINIQKYGNTSAASIPIALHEAKKAGRFHEDDLILLTVLGAGLTWGAALIRW